MASGRRPAPPDLKGTLGSLIRSTLEQVGAMTEVARREASRQRTRLDGALHERRRQAALAALGEAVYGLHQAGQLDLEDLPELRAALDAIAALDDGDDEQARSPREAWAGMPRSSEQRSGARPVRPGDRVWRPNVEEAPADDAELVGATPPRRRDERPTRADTPRRRRPAGDLAGGIAFVTDDGPSPSGDEDLSDYMHADDVTPRTPRGRDPGER